MVLLFHFPELLSKLLGTLGWMNRGREHSKVILSNTLVTCKSIKMFRVLLLCRIFRWWLMLGKRVRDLAMANTTSPILKHRLLAAAPRWILNMMGDCLHLSDQTFMLMQIFSTVFFMSPLHHHQKLLLYKLEYSSMAIVDTIAYEILARSKSNS